MFESFGLVGVSVMVLFAVVMIYVLFFRKYKGPKMNFENPAQYNSCHQMQPLKNPGIAAVLSFFLPGLGQIYNGQIIWGIIVMVIVMPLTALITFGLMTVAAQSTVLGAVFIPLLLPVVMWIGTVVSAYKTAESINRKRYISLNTPV